MQISDLSVTQAKRLSYATLIIILFSSLIIDQLSKHNAQDQLMVWQDKDNLKAYGGKAFPLFASKGNIELSPDFEYIINFNYVRNQGAAWGFLSDADERFRVPFFYFITAVAVFILLQYIVNTPLNHRLARFSYTLILSGALGNFIDRILHGYVIDFIDVRWSIPIFNLGSWRYDFPNFNWADSCISVGITLLLIDTVFFEGKRKKLAGQHKVTENN